MAKKLTFQERVLKFIKKHKKVTTKHTILATVLILTFVLAVPIFDSQESVSADEEEDSIFTAAMVGDMMFGRFVKEATDRHGYDYLFRHVEPLLEQSDYVSGNFANPVVLEEGYQPAEKDVVFKTEEEAVKALERNHFTHVNLANNHVVDYGQEGVADTVATLESHNVGFSGAGMSLEEAKDIHYEEVNGLTVATLGFTDVFTEGDEAAEGKGGVLPADPSIYIPLVKEADEHADLVMVRIHWGQAYDSNIHPRQEEMAKAMADAGADVIAGHSPHVLLSTDVYKDTLIMYSLGNFIFDQGWSQTRDTAVAEYRLSEDGQAQLVFHPFRIYEGQPRTLDGPLSILREKQIFKRLTKNTSPHTQWYEEDGKLKFQVDHSHVVKGDTPNDQASYED
ncbi:CapA family protein [Alteribacillus iranensis]|uniref:Poly-gamma-glutamate synthesis protein (Capsule biosynthesis protein) n=1 Tax=Alteribacillus iranensis TaxID=930128 RepID=A0A1I2BZJ1_9BACI|nr:CapA family protein [Alteribacillus iranensis]SFE60730.1 poly-gamma-glutamate synthesis protein (capsule biosynthesis protein) [Alteribacillus iranensis]